MVAEVSDTVIPPRGEWAAGGVRACAIGTSRREAGVGEGSGLDRENGQRGGRMNPRRHLSRRVVWVWRQRAEQADRPDGGWAGATAVVGGVARMVQLWGAMNEPSPYPGHPTALPPPRFSRQWRLTWAVGRPRPAEPDSCRRRVG